MTPFLQLSEHSVKLKFLFQGPQRLFNIPGVDFYLQDRPPPPYPPPRFPLLPPPPNPERPPSVFGRASFTVIVRSMRVEPFMVEIAFAASSSDVISTKPNPFDLPVV
jgi:hypothetical protein